MATSFGDRIRERSGFSLGKLVGANVLGQLIGLAALPSIARLYGPNEFGVLATYAAVLASVAPIAAWRFDAAIPAAQTSREGDELLLLAISAAAITAFISFLAIELLIEFWPDAPAALQTPLSRILMPFGILAASWMVAFQFAAVRRKQFSIIGVTRLIQPTISSSVQLGAGLASVPQGLVIGHFINAGAGVGLLFRKQWPRARRHWFASSPQRLRQVARDYLHFPRQSVVEELARNLSLQIPLLLLATWMGAAEAGLVFLAMRILGTPQLVLANSVSQIFYSNCRAYQDEGRLGAEVLQLAERLTNFFVVPMLFLGWLGGPLSKIAFGPSWEPLGALIGWMLPWYALRVLVTSISPALYVAGRTALAASLAVTGLVFHLLPLIFAKWWAPPAMAEALAIGAGAFYLIASLVLIARVARQEFNLFRRLVRLSSVWIGAFAAGYAVFRFLPAHLNNLGI